MMALGIILLISLASALGGPQCQEAQTTTEMRVCLDRELRASEERLNELETSLVKRLSARQGVLFHRARTAWILYRDLQCESEASQFDGGTMAPVAELQCHLRLTDQRRMDVEAAFREGN
jgi:uncharacterized protein YecT (DUF1311 family)